MFLVSGRVVLGLTFCGFFIDGILMRTQEKWLSQRFQNPATEKTS
jgi:hypothetical protein